MKILESLKCMPSHFPNKSRGSDLNLLVFDASALVEDEDQSVLGVRDICLILFCGFLGTHPT